MTDDHEIPDFSGDDFANDKDIQKERAAIKAYNKMIDDALALIKKELNVQDASHINLKGFEMFKSLTATIIDSLRSVNESKALQVSLARYNSSYPIARSSNGGTDLYLFGHITLKNNYPHTYIHKETIKEKIADIFLKLEVDFPDSKKFSRRFYVLTEDKKKLQDILQFKDLDQLTAFPDMEMEFSSNTLLFRSSRKPVSLEEAAVFCELAKTLLTLFS
ncbi:hypothetical protein [Ferruginibacter sp.]